MATIRVGLPVALVMSHGMSWNQSEIKVSGHNVYPDTEQNAFYLNARREGHVETSKTRSEALFIFSFKISVRPGVGSNAPFTERDGRRPWLCSPLTTQIPALSVAFGETAELP